MAERLGAWLEDQKLTAEALGQTGEAWMARVERGFETYGQKTRGDAPKGEANAPESPSTQTARRLLGNATREFTNRPAPGESKQAGLRGLLATRSFQKKPKK